MSLRKKLIRLAYHKPHLRSHLLPLLKKAGCGCSGDSEDAELNLSAEDLEAARRYDPLKKDTNREYGKDYVNSPGNWKPENRGEGRCYYQTGDEADRCYVTTKGGPGGKTKPKSGPAGKNKSKERKEYNKKYRKQRWPGGNRSAGFASRYLIAGSENPLARLRGLLHDSPSVKINQEIVEIRNENPGLRRVIDDYLNQHKYPSYVASMSLNVYQYDDYLHEWSLVDGGMVDDDVVYLSLDDLIDDFKGQASWIRWSSYPPTGLDWISSSPEMTEGGRVEEFYNLWIRKTDREPLTMDEIRYISKRLRLL